MTNGALNLDALHKQNIQQASDHQVTPHLKVLDITITTGIPETEKENNVPGINIHNFFFDK